MKKTALVTGSTGGIGSAVTAMLAERGFGLLLSDLDANHLAEQAGSYADCRTLAVDMADRDAVAAFCSKINETDEIIDLAFVNAGMLIIGDLTDLAPEDVEKQLQVNLVSASLIIQALAKAMSERGSGHIIVTVSLGAVVSLKGSATYSASKFGLRGLLWALRDEILPKGVSVTGIYPAGVDTPMLRHEARDDGSALNFVGTPVTVDDISRAVSRAIDKPRLEVYVPYSESITGRLAGAFPWILSSTYPFFEWLGERGRKAFLKRIGDLKE